MTRLPKTKLDLVLGVRTEDGWFELSMEKGSASAEQKASAVALLDELAGGPSTDLFYIQDTRSIVGNSMLWWRKGGHGYACDIREAHQFEREEAEGICKTKHFRMWPVDFINGRVSHHIDIQKCSRDQLVKGGAS